MQSLAGKHGLGLSAMRQVQCGVTSVEYALMAVLIALAVIGGLSATGSGNGGIWERWTAAAIAAITP